jgi:hypothetical protein
MKKIILIFSLFTCFSFHALAQETPIDLVKKTNSLVKDPDLVGDKKELIKETQALIKDVQGLTKLKKGLRFSKQQPKFQIGLTFHSFNFYNYKSFESEESPDFITPQNFNNFAVGLSFRKKLTKGFSLKSELTYASQNEGFTISRRRATDAQGIHHFIYDSTIKIKYGQVKLPLLIEYELKLGTKSTWSLRPYLGTQIAFLTRFKVVSKTYYYPHSGNFNPDFDINNAELERLTINDSGVRYYTNWNHGRVSIFAPEGTFYYPGGKYQPFRRLLFGVVGGMDIEKMLSPSLALGLGFRYDYNLSKTEKEGYEPRIGKSYSHQKRIGMNISLLKTIH